MERSKRTDISIQQNALKKAQDAADSGDSLEMFKCLCDSMIIEACKIHFEYRYPTIDAGYIHDEIGTVIDEIYARVSKKQRIREIDGYLWRVVDIKLSEFAFKRLQVTELKDDHLNIEDTVSLSDEERKKSEMRKNNIIAIAESLIPRLGLVNVQEVMKYVLGAIKNNIRSIPSSEIADALGLTAVNVRKSKERGFKKLARLVKEEKLVEESYNFSFLDEVESLMREDEDNINSE
ncbi:MAG: hypothetical protein ABIT05_13425 [Chitinophagaceae bacterium]